MSSPLYSKFIVQGENLILGKCTYHKQLVTNPKEVKGGGWFNYNPEKSRFTFNGDSYEFGMASVGDIRKCVELGNVWANRKMTRKLDKCKFAYLTKSGERIELN